MLALLVNMSRSPHPPAACHQVPRKHGVMVAPPHHLEFAALLAQLDNMASRSPGEPQAEQYTEPWIPIKTLPLKSKIILGTWSQKYQNEIMSKKGLRSKSSNRHTKQLLHPLESGCVSQRARRARLRLRHNDPKQTRDSGSRAGESAICV